MEFESMQNKSNILHEEPPYGSEAWKAKIRGIADKERMEKEKKEIESRKELEKVRTRYQAKLKEDEHQRVMGIHSVAMERALREREKQEKEGASFEGVSPKEAIKAFEELEKNKQVTEEEVKQETKQEREDREAKEAVKAVNELLRKNFPEEK